MDFKGVNHLSAKGDVYAQINMLQKLFNFLSPLLKVSIKIYFF